MVADATTFMSHRGLEPRTTWLKVKCSTTWANGPKHKKCLVPESNQRHEDFQSSALPTELTRQKKRVAGTGFEPVTFGLWARRASRLLHPAILNYKTKLIILYAKNKNIWLISKWMEVDSNHRSNLQQIYSLSPLATRESIHKMILII